MRLSYQNLPEKKKDAKRVRLLDDEVFTSKKKKQHIRQSPQLRVKSQGVETCVCLCCGYEKTYNVYINGCFQK